PTRRVGVPSTKFFEKTFVHIENSRGVLSMSTFLPSPAGTRTLIRPLGSSMRTGKPYSRHPDVEAEIQTLLRLPQSEWMAKAGELHSETIVFLMRLVRYGNEQL